MATPENKAVVMRFYEELWNQRQVGVADEIFTSDCVTHQLKSGSEDDGVVRNPEAIKHHVAGWLEAFPDLRFDVEQILAEGDDVVSRCVMQGTHTGAWFGIAPSGRSISIRMIVMHRIRDGKIVEDWVLVESLGFFQQLGLVPSTEEILATGSRAARPQ